MPRKKDAANEGRWERNNHKVLFYVFCNRQTFENNCYKMQRGIFFELPVPKTELLCMPALKVSVSNMTSSDTQNGGHAATRFSWEFHVPHYEEHSSNCSALQSERSLSHMSWTIVIAERAHGGASVIISPSHSMFFGNEYNIPASDCDCVYVRHSCAHCSCATRMRGAWRGRKLKTGCLP